MTAARIPFSTMWSLSVARPLSPTLTAALALSLLVHGLLLGLQFRMPEPKPLQDKGLAVVLVNARHERAPEEAEVLAQANVDAGGTTDQEARPTTPLPPQQTSQEGDALVESKRRSPEPQPQHQPALTQDKAPARTAATPASSEQPTPAPPARGLDLLDNAAAVARLEAEIARQMDEIAKRPRKINIGSRAREFRFAQYVEDWRQKVERVGTLNFPEAARGRLYGSLLLTVSITADGKVREIHIDRSSGHPVLDEAAVRIVRLAAPYAAFPPDIRRDTDIIEITRTWTFTNSSQLQAR